jgi:hydrogenase nickel incorporation protein HypA/HybF
MQNDEWSTNCGPLHLLPVIHPSSFILHHFPRMHELSIVEALIDQVTETLAPVGEHGRVLRIELTIGRLSGVNCDSVRFAFDLLAPGTVVEHADLLIREPKAVCHCQACGAESEIDEIVLDCPKCGSSEIAIQEGRELVLQSIEIEESS